MPRYDYKCEKNGHIFEVVQGFNDEAVAFCPDDGSESVRQLSIPHVIYKGSGFYTTDYKSNGSNGSSSNGSSSSDSSGDSSSSGSTSSEKKSEAKSESKASGAAKSAD